MAAEIKSIAESDKPFILAVIFALAFVGLIFGGLIGVNYGNPYITEYIEKMLPPIIAIVGSVVAFYFGKKSQ